MCCSELNSTVQCVYINKDHQKLMVDPMIMIVKNLRLFLPAVTTTAVTPTAVILYNILDEFRPYWTILYFFGWPFWPLLNFLYHFGNMDHIKSFWKCRIILYHFGPCWTILKHFDNVDYFDHFRTFGLFEEEKNVLLRIIFGQFWAILDNFERF